MSVSAATQRRTSTRHPSFALITLAVLGALALVAVLVAISVPNTSSGTVGATAQSDGVASAPGVAARGYFRDPTTHALVPLASPTPTESTPGPGHK